MHTIEFRSGKATRVLFTVLAILLALHFTVAFSHLVLHLRVAALSQLADLDLESNLPTFFNCGLFFLAAPLFYLHGRSASPKDRRGWFVMAGIFVFLGIDEGSQIHEKLMNVTNRLLHDSGAGGPAMDWLFFAWVIPYGLALLGLVAVLFRWFTQMEPKLRRNLVISGVVYVSGAIVMEMIGSKVLMSIAPKDVSAYPWMPCEVYGDPSGCWAFMEPGYVALYTVEETLEMTGLILCIRALLQAFERNGQRLSLNLAGEASQRA